MIGNQPSTHEILAGALQKTILDFRVRSSPRLSTCSRRFSVKRKGRNYADPNSYREHEEDAEIWQGKFMNFKNMICNQPSTQENQQAHCRKLFWTIE